MSDEYEISGFGKLIEGDGAGWETGCGREQRQDDQGLGRRIDPTRDPRGPTGDAASVPARRGPPAGQFGPSGARSEGALREANIDLFLVNPNRPRAHGVATYPSLTAIGQPIDALLCLIGAEGTIATAAEARTCDAGGMVAIAGGFAEAGAAGTELQYRLVEACAGELALLGPNCNGFINLRSGARLTGAPPICIPKGGASLITHSGGLINVIAAAVTERGGGFSHLISTGNEAALDMADCIEFLAEDANTQVICLAVETIRRPERFFEALGRAHAAGKPVVALKYGRSARGRQIATSHTGAVVGDSWVYDVGLRQHGVAVAADVLEFADRIVGFQHIDRARWRSIKGLAIASLSGGWAAMASDVCEDEKVDLPALEALAPQIAAIIPGTTVVNPLDLTGKVISDPASAGAAFEALIASDEVDALLVPWSLDKAGLASGAAVIEPLKRVAQTTSKPIILSSMEDGPLSAWARDLPNQGVMPGRGLRASIRALSAMNIFMAHQERLAQPRPTTVQAVAPRPPSPSSSSSPTSRIERSSRPCGSRSPTLTFGRQ